VVHKGGSGQFLIDKRNTLMLTDLHRWPGHGEGF
jgi:hypothetical protein